MSRVRRVADQREMEHSIDEFITRGYKIKSEGESSTRLKKRDLGDAITHVILIALTGWWTFGLSNALYAAYRYANAEEVIIKIDESAGDDQ